LQRVRRKGARLKTATRNEIRTQGELADGRPALDEIVADGDFAMSGGRLHVHLSDQGDEYAEWEGDNRKRPFPGNGA
jgi:hypothetical protein